MTAIEKFTAYCQEKGIDSPIRIDMLVRHNAHKINQGNVAPNELEYIIAEVQANLCIEVEYNSYGVNPLWY